MSGTRVKICCIASIDEARTAIEHGADAIGLVSAMPSGPGPIDEALIADIAAAVRGRADTFLLTCRTRPDDIAGQLRRCRPATVQLVDAVDTAVYARLRDAAPGVRIVQVLHVEGETTLAGARHAAPHVDALLLDSGRPAAAVRELGGTGRVHDWSLSRRVVDAVEVPVWLAGGLHADNVAAAIEAVRPHGVDLCNGVRTHGRLDRAKLAAFTAAVAGASGKEKREKRGQTP